MTTTTRVDPHLHPRVGTYVELACRVIYGVSVAAMGVICLRAGDLGSVFQTVPRWLPLHAGLAYASGAVMLAGGLALLARKTARPAALVLTVHFAAWLLLLSLPTALTHARVAGAWEACGLDMSVLAGGWILLALSARAPAGAAADGIPGGREVTLARRIYALGIPLVGIAHFVNAHDATVYVPTWLPLRIDWVYLTGAGHIAAGLAILFGVLPRLAARLEAAQITAFVVLAHIPAVLATPGDLGQWTQLIYALAIAASAWLVAATLGDGSAMRASAAPARGTAI